MVSLSRRAWLHWIPSHSPCAFPPFAWCSSMRFLASLALDPGSSASPIVSDEPRKYTHLHLGGQDAGMPNEELQMRSAERLQGSEEWPIRSDIDCVILTGRLVKILVKNRKSRAVRPAGRCLHCTLCSSTAHDTPRQSIMTPSKPINHTTSSCVPYRICAAKRSRC